jgi:hypothetical protein
MTRFAISPVLPPSYRVRDMCITNILYGRNFDKQFTEDQNCMWCHGRIEVWKNGSPRTMSI